MIEYYTLGHDPNASWIVSRLLEFENNTESVTCVFNVAAYHALMIRDIYGLYYHIEIIDMAGTSFKIVRVKKK